MKTRIKAVQRKLAEAYAEIESFHQVDMQPPQKKALMEATAEMHRLSGAMFWLEREFDSVINR